MTSSNYTIMKIYCWWETLMSLIILFRLCWLLNFQEGKSRESWRKSWKNTFSFIQFKFFMNSSQRFHKTKKLLKLFPRRTQSSKNLKTERVVDRSRACPEYLIDCFPFEEAKLMCKDLFSIHKFLATSRKHDKQLHWVRLTHCIEWKCDLIISFVPQITRQTNCLHSC